MFCAQWRIIYATAVHPRTGMLTGTLAHGMNDFGHFAILFIIVFVFFAFTARWMFGQNSNQVCYCRCSNSDLLPRLSSCVLICLSYISLQT